MALLIIGMIMLAAGAYVALENASIARRQVNANVKRASSYAVLTNETNDEMSKSARERLLVPLLNRFSELASRISPQGKKMELVRKIRAAGLNTKPQTLLAFKGVFVSLGIIVIVFAMLSATLPLVLVGLAVFVAGFMGPDFWLNGRVKTRQEEMERSLPDTLDLLTVSVEAGLGFDAAVAKVCEKMSGPLIEEFDAMSSEIKVGVSRRQALRNMGERVDSDDIRSFVRSIIQADEMGTSLGRTLKVQSSDMRIHRQLSAEEKAMKAPVKMLFPTVIFIFPAMFISILGPAFLNIMEAFKNV